jgi:DNA repair exonuclease SbcCD ATPase subunit
VRQVIFEKINIQNFLSVGSPGIELNFQTGITILTGENRDKGGRNGVGKSSVIESIYWCLFGNTLRDIKRDKIIHNQSKENCFVCLNFCVKTQDSIKKYILTRSIEPSKVSLYCNDEDITRSSMPKTDELIKEIIGANEEIFQNAVVMSSNNTLPFMAQKKVDKRKFVEGVLHLGIFGEMLLCIRADHNEAKKENDILSNLFLSKQKNLQIYQTQSDKIEQDKIEKTTKLQDKIKNNLIQIKDLSNLSVEDIEAKQKNNSDKILKCEDKIKKIEELSLECSSHYNLLNSEILELQFNINSLSKELDAHLQKTQICPTCKRTYDTDDEHTIKEHIKELKTKIKTLVNSKEIKEKEIKKHQKSCNVLIQTISDLKDTIKKLKDENWSLNIIAKDIEHLNTNNLDLEKQIEEIQKLNNNFENLIKETKEEILKDEESLEVLQKKINILESCKYVVSEEGVKTHIIKKMLSLLNCRLNFYLQALEAPCKCEFNEMFEETIYNEIGAECSYFNFSGGERKRIDLAILFMFQDLLRMQTGTSFSLSIYDELFDSAIDEKGIDKVLSILRDRVETYQENIYIVSHNKSAIKANIDRIILLEKNNGKTSLIQQTD